MARKRGRKLLWRKPAIDVLPTCRKGHVNPVRGKNGKCRECVNSWMAKHRRRLLADPVTADALRAKWRAEKAAQSGRHAL
jgi:hypothetical protein